MRNLSIIISNFIKTTFRSLKYRDFRLFWFGQCISLTGTWLQRTAQVWLVYTLTESPLMVGIIGVCQFMPLMLFSLFAGVIVDRFPKKKILLFTQIVFMLQAGLMTVLTFTGAIRVEHVLVLSVIYGLNQTLDTPARQSFFIHLVGRENVTNAISLNSTIFNLARIVGPALSGFLMVKFSMVFCFFMNTVSFIPVIAGIAMIKSGGEVPHHVTGHVLSQVAGGLRYVFKNDTLILNMLAMAVFCTFAMNNDVIIPVFAREVLGRGAEGYTGLLSASGIGAFIGAIVLAYISRHGMNKKMLLFAGTLSATIQVLMYFSRQYLLSALLLAAIGFINIAFLNTANSIFQLNSSDEYRGRVMSVYAFLNQGSTPIGNFFAGTAMEHLGGEYGYISCGGVTLLALAIIFVLRRKTVKSWLAE
ncbi:permease [[Clostridium] cellulosi]|uniref:Permease n=1 Tax=[Clostridium] cellulosi TaxID=29343 RepID=A0A078KRC2_9FIRM|nr:permease [[Clostridium] cellulosi]